MKFFVRFVFAVLAIFGVIAGAWIAGDQLQKAQEIMIAPGVLLAVPGKPFRHDIAPKGDGWSITPGVVVSVTAAKGISADCKISYYLKGELLGHSEAKIEDGCMWMHPPGKDFKYDESILTLEH